MLPVILTKRQWLVVLETLRCADAYYHDPETNDVVFDIECQLSAQSDWAEGIEDDDASA